MNRPEPVVRELTDAAGLRWTVRRFESQSGQLIGPRLGPPLVCDRTSGSWLTFECVPTGWLRRLSPAPEDWATCSEARMLEYFASARHVRRRPKSGPLP